MRFTVTVVPLIASVAALSLGCAGDPPSGPSPRDSTLAVQPGTVSLGLGDTLSLTATLFVGGTDMGAVAATWESVDSTVASVTPDGLATGVAIGSTSIVASAFGLRDSATAIVSTVAHRAPTLELVAESPVGSLTYVTAPASDSSRLFAVAQAGVIYVIRNDTLLATPFLDLRDRVRAGGERGLLSIAFHPSFATNGRVFVSYTDTLGDSRIERYTATGPETADPASAVPILSLTQPYGNHNGGQIAFGPDGMLYIGFGDGGSAGDPLGSGQNLETLLGKILRIDVDAGTPYVVPADNPFVGDPNALPEIWAYGLRNPWRFSFDRATGDLYIADVGQSLWEEVNVQPAASIGGQNYGWNVMEASACYDASSCDAQGKVLPVVEYSHTEGCSVTGGFVYRGSAVPLLEGWYLYADYCRGWVRSFRYVGGQVTDQTEWSDLAPPGAFVTSFGQDARGELYVMTAAGRLFRIVEQ